MVNNADRLRVAAAAPADMPAILSLYDDVIAATAGTDNDPLWVRGLHPSEAELAAAVEAGELLVGWLTEGSEREGAGERAGAGERECAGAGERVGARLEGAAPAAERERERGHAGERERLVAVLVVNDEGAQGYDDVPWRVEARPGEVAVLHLFAVHPDFQGRGLAWRMLDAAQDLARSRGKRVMRLDTLESNRGAQRLYDRYGFANLGPARLAYDDPRVTSFVLYELAL